MKNENWDIIGGSKSVEEAFVGGCALSPSTFPGHHVSSRSIPLPHDLLASTWGSAAGVPLNHDPK